MEILPPLSDTRSWPGKKASDRESHMEEKVAYGKPSTQFLEEFAATLSPLPKTQSAVVTGACRRQQIESRDVKTASPYLAQASLEALIFQCLLLKC